MSTLASALKLEVPVIVCLGTRTMSVEDVIALVPGAIIELDKRAELELDLMVNNRVIGAGTAVKIGENFGIRVTFIGGLKDRIEAMAQTQDTANAEESLDAMAEALLANQI